MKAILAIPLAMLLLGASDATKFDYATAGRIAVVNNGRVKPLDSFAREFLRTMTGKEKFAGYRDPQTNEFVEVFGDRDPVAAILLLAAQPDRFRTLRFIRLDHPTLKKEYGLDIHRVYFSLQDFDPIRERLLKESDEIVRDDATSSQRAILQVVDKMMGVQFVMEEQLLSIVPVPYGTSKGWLTPQDIQRYLQFKEGMPSDGRFHAAQSALDDFTAADPKRREKLAKIVETYGAMKGSVARNDAGAFNVAIAELAGALKSLNVKEYPPDEDVEREIWYHAFRPFSWSSGLFGLAALLFLMGYVYGSKAVWGVSMAVHGTAIGMTAYGYGLRWMIADRYPLSNHYESMIAVALFGAVISFIAELVMKKRIFGFAGATAGVVMVLLANTVPAFADQSAFSTIMPALQTFWMTVHVPVIMAGYAGGLMICILGHVYIFTFLFRRGSPEKEAQLAELDNVLYRALQVTVLFLLAGILLGAVWAGEAWGRPWGWDMKETWALITFISYLATLHGRFTGVVRGMGTALAALGSFVLLVLCYYGVNFLFGKGLHTYGFGSGEVLPVAIFFIIEGVIATAAFIAWLKRRPPVSPELVRP